MRIKVIQEIIDRFRGKIFALESVVNKYECYKRAKIYHTLALGSSHMEFGYIPDDCEINMGSASQDLYYSYNLYRKLNKDCLKNVIVTYSVFSSGDFLIKSGLNRISIMFKLLYGIPYQNPEIASKCKFSKWEKFYDKNIKKYQKSLNLPDNYNGKFLKDRKDILNKNEEKKIEIRALKHYKISQKEEKQTEYLIKLLEETKENNQNLYFVIPPATTYYKGVLPKSEIIFKDLYQICNDYNHVNVINLYDSTEFKNDDFVDGDHLNSNGCAKFTRILRDMITKE